MKLFEITTGWMGMSYERCYAWAETEAQALKMFNDMVAGEPKYANRADRIEVLELFDATAAPFITVLSSEGFELESE
jgi:hypothetical protein